MRKSLTLLILLTVTNVSAEYDVSLICESSFDGQIYNLIEEQDATCLSDFVWGAKGVCYEGNSETLVDLINNEFFDTQSKSFNEALSYRDGSISYIGYDKANFWSDKRTIYPCKN